MEYCKDFILPIESGNDTEIKDQENTTDSTDLKALDEANFAIIKDTGLYTSIHLYLYVAITAENGETARKAWQTTYGKLSKKLELLYNAAYPGEM